MRLDLYLVEKGFFKSRSKAKSEIEASSVLVNNKIITKSSYEVLDTDIITINDLSCPYVSRGGLKLEGAINEFYLDFKDKVVVDIGASTGGFTDCALKHGAKKVFAVDVGTNQLDESLRNDPRVISYEQTNIKDITSFGEKIDYLVMDVSFVSIKHLLKEISAHITDDNELVCLIKPQFEVGKVHMKNGIVKDRTVHINVIESIVEELKLYGLGIEKLCVSPILGGSGNKEFLSLIKRNVKTNINIVEVLRKGE